MGIINQTLFFAEATTRGGARPGEGVECPISVKSLSQERDPSVSNSRDTSSKDTKHCFFLKKTISKYQFDKQGDCSHGHHTHAKANKSSRSAGTLYNELAKANKGPVGPKYSNRVQNRFYHRTLSTQNTQPKPIEPTPTGAGIPGDLRVDLKGSPVPGNGFLSTLFLVPKKDGGQRPVINLKSLNSFVNAPHFKMEGIHTLKSLLKKGDWLLKIDLKDAYFSIPISIEHRKYLCFQLENKTYQFNCLPFGLASAPWVFTKTLKPIAALGRELGIRLVVT